MEPLIDVDARDSLVLRLPLAEQLLGKLTRQHALCIHTSMGGASEVRDPGVVDDDFAMVGARQAVRKDVAIVSYRILIE